MRQRIFAVMGATGNVGRVVVEELLKRGHTVRAIGRDERKLRELELKGAIAIPANFDEINALSMAFKDAYSVFSFIPPAVMAANLGEVQDIVGAAIVQAIQDAGIQRVVNLSSVGAERPDGTGPIKGLYRQEQRLNALQDLITLVHIRANFFMENLNGQIPIIESEGELRSPLLGDLTVPMVATRDIGWKAADFLDDTAPHPHLVFDFAGPKEVTLEYAAELFSHALARPIKFVQISYDEAREGMIKHGMPRASVDLFIEMYKGFNEGKILPTQELKASHCGTTSLEEYIAMLVHRLYAHLPH